ncbi:MAG: metallophosphoesterase [Ilumatobacteraceae bacterium]
MQDRQFAGYDVIGDIHGHADELVGLLGELGYSESPQPSHPRQQGLWSHPLRQAIFVGDLIDRGPQQVRTVDLVRSMVEAGSARMVLGNHEFNAIAWATRDPEVPGDHLRTHLGERGEKNRHQHEEFLQQVGGDSPLHHDYIAWFRSLPLWIELDAGLRVVHACWDQRSMDLLKPLLAADHSLTRQALVEGSRKGSPQYEAIEVILKGPEIDLPDTHHYCDKDGNVRRRARMRWWDPNATTLRQVAELLEGTNGPDGGVLSPVPETPLDAGVHQPYTEAVPVAFGHYWRSPATAICTATTVCVDYSAGSGGPVVAYRWSGGPFDETQLVGFPSLEQSTR